MKSLRSRGRKSLSCAPLNNASKWVSQAVGFLIHHVTYERDPEGSKALQTSHRTRQRLHSKQHGSDSESTHVGEFAIFGSDYSEAQMTNWQLMLKIHVVGLIDSTSSMMYKHGMILFLSITDTGFAP